ncbi:tudor domain-containing protein 3 [Galendromus occidentalis]|uniref:Tudor domain-containing protein 3 n=1 Tax=Galendromus occidentalis TaxID=34638 RepID=A0AAJ6VYJ0_9ACAR|nr:tudor domain-containing protein 3 [Galendromus occidentalis]
MASSLKDQLEQRGWFLTDEAIAELSEGIEKLSAIDVIQRALDTDLSEIGSGSIPEELAKNLKNAEKVSGPAVYQIQRIRNVSAPKSDQDNERDNKMLRIYLTDGVTQFSAVLSGKSSVSIKNTCPGTKILLNPQSVPVCNGIIILSERDFKVLGGTVQKLVDKWKLAKDLSQHKRSSGEAGPPPWVPFGEQINKDLIRQLKTGGPFRAMERAGVTKVAPNEAFERHRMSNIEEVTANQPTAKKKVFGSGAREMHDADIAQICAKGFSAEAAANALRNNSYNVTAALQALTIRGDRGDRQSGRTGDANRENGQKGGRGDDNADRFRGGPKKRGGRNPDEGSRGTSDHPSMQPSNPTTLFDMISTKMNIPEQPNRREEFRPAHGNGHDAYESGGRQKNWSGSKENSDGFRQERRGTTGRGGFRRNQRQDSYVSEFPTLSSAGVGAEKPREAAENHSTASRPSQQHSEKAPSPRQDMKPGQSQMGQSSTITHKFKPGQRVFAKYWEDNRMYRAVVHEMAATGGTCVVQFVEYGNYEEVLVEDVELAKVPGWGGEEGFDERKVPPHSQETERTGMNSFQQQSRTSNGGPPSHERGGAQQNRYQDNAMRKNNTNVVCVSNLLLRLGAKESYR